MNPREIREKQEHYLMLKCFMEDEEKTEEGRMRAMLDVEFIQGCLSVQRLRTFNKVGTRKTGYMAMLDTFENLLMQRIMQDYDLGINPKTTIHIDDIVKITYLFTFKYLKQKGSIGKLRKHKDVREIYANDLESAELALKGKIKKLKEILIEITSVDKSISTIYLKDGRSFNNYQAEIMSILIISKKSNTIMTIQAETLIY